MVESVIALVLVAGMLTHQNSTASVVSISHPQLVWSSLALGSALLLLSLFGYIGVFRENKGVLTVYCIGMLNNYVLYYKPIDLEIVVFVLTS